MERKTEMVPKRIKRNNYRASYVDREDFYAESFFEMSRDLLRARLYS